MSLDGYLARQIKLVVYTRLDEFNFLGSKALRLLSGPQEFLAPHSFQYARPPPPRVFCPSPPLIDARLPVCKGAALTFSLKRPTFQNPSLPGLAETNATGPQQRRKPSTAVSPQ